MAFRWKGDIYVKPVGAEAVVQVTKDPAVDSWPAWSPDGSQIAFVRNGEVFLVSPLGGPERKVAESRAGWRGCRMGRLFLFSRRRRRLRTEYLPRVACDRAEAAPHIPERASSWRHGHGNVARRPDACVLPSALREGCDLFLCAAEGGEHTG